MSLKERIINEMVVDEITLKIFRQLPKEMQTHSNFIEVEKKVKEGEV